MAKNVKITKRVVDAVEPSDKRVMIWDSEISGFGLRVTPSGHKSYLLKYRVGGGRSGRVRWAVIGPHGKLTPDQARDIAKGWAAEIALGGDPARDRDAARTAPTVSELLERYMTEHVDRKNKASTAKDVRRIIQNGKILPTLGKIKVAEVQRSDIARLHTSMSSTPYSANRTLAHLSTAFSLAEIWGLRPDGSNPCRKVERYKEQARERFLSPTEFQRLGEVLAQAEQGPLVVTGNSGEDTLSRVNPEAIRAIRLLIFTGARVGEILGLRWEYISLEAGRAALPDSKTGKKTIQLPPPAMQVLQQAKRPKNGTGYVICPAPLFSTTDLRFL